jgi:hypothetical protein
MGDAGVFLNVVVSAVKNLPRYEICLPQLFALNEVGGGFLEKVRAFGPLFSTHTDTDTCTHTHTHGYRHTQTYTQTHKDTHR